jgi:hypothetical protein
VFPRKNNVCISCFLFELYLRSVFTVLVSVDLNASNHKVFCYVRHSPVMSVYLDLGFCLVLNLTLWSEFQNPLLISDCG